MSPFEISVRFFLQLAVVLLVCRLVSALARRAGQPPVVGEMIAGVVLGPSLFGLVFPAAQAWIFPQSSRAVLLPVAQLGLALYMFTVGLEFRVDMVKSRWRAATAVSISGIAAPFVLGCLVAVGLVQAGGFFGASVSLGAAMPYLGAAMAITAFPMLARIISERKLTGTPEGTLALAAGAIDDAAAWGVLAVVLAGLSGDVSKAGWAIGGGLAFVVVLKLAKPLLARVGRHWERSADDRGASLGSVLVLLMLSAWFTDWIGLYAVFGAFFFGMAMPRGPFVDHVRALIEPLTTKLLLPLFFIYSGLNTRFDLLTSGWLWMVALAVFVAAVLGKAGACYAAARLSGESHRVALGVGALMNARGLMELIIINIGLERGIITPALFSIMVFMAIATTLMATPLFNRVQKLRE
ncbi:MAG TPA: cation:proton antiporter [Rariglobus sp.]|jgi:Kef-type K+ transport system membrane component KefB|nr:cation:proton antiporter [Rariglobus sp.]